jgi:beta-xylosidase
MFSQKQRSLWVSTAIVALALNLTAEGLYKNPVIPGDHPDPSIIRVGGDYWATCTSSAWGPLFPLLHSRDLVNWDQTGAVLPHRPEWATGDFWAPEISEFKGKFFVYFVARQRDGRLAVSVATADKPEGPYTAHEPLVAQPDGSIDPAPVVDTNGVRYLVWKEDGNSRNKPTPIWLQRLSDDGTKLIEQPRELIRNDARWEGNLVEGPFILRRNGWFYLFYSANGCCGEGCTYALGVARSRSLPGPWEKNPANPILAGNVAWKCPGHGSIVQDEQGRYFLLYHGYSTTGTIFTGREALLDEVIFGADDWPTINQGMGPSISAISPLAAVQKDLSAASFSDNFAGDKLGTGWQWPQQREPRYRLADGKLHLSSGALRTNFLSAVLARLTTALDYVVTTSIETSMLQTNASAGVCAFGDMDNAAGAAVQNGSIIVWRRERGQIRELSRQPRLAGDRLFLRLESRRGFHFQLAASADGVRWTPCGEAADAKNLPPWDRAVRVALTAGGGAGAEGVFESFSIKPLENAKP